MVVTVAGANFGDKKKKEETVVSASNDRIINSKS
jgi:hypothetical protein